MATSCDHMDHVRTQLPYALLVGFVRLDGLGRSRRLRGIRVVREDHALPRLARIYPEDGAHGRPHVKRYASETGAKTHGIVGQLEIVRGRLTDVKNDFAVLDMFLRHSDAVKRRIDNDMRRMAIVGHPLVHGANQVRTF